MIVGYRVNNLLLELYHFLQGDHHVKIVFKIVIKTVPKPHWNCANPRIYSRRIVCLFSIWLINNILRKNSLYGFGAEETRSTCDLCTVLSLCAHSFTSVNRASSTYAFLYQIPRPNFFSTFFHFKFIRFKSTAVLSSLFPISGAR